MKKKTIKVLVFLLDGEVDFVEVVHTEKEALEILSEYHMQTFKTVEEYEEFKKRNNGSVTSSWVEKAL